MKSENTVERIKEAMYRLRMNQAQMGRYLGVPQGTISNWMQGTRSPNTVVDRLLDVLGTLEVVAPAIHDGFIPRKEKKVKDAV